MTNQQKDGMPVEEGNILIAKFMGAKKSKIDGPGNWIRYPAPHAGTETFAFWPKHLKYHSSWDWLMPVVEKIESTRTTDKVRKNIVPTNVIISKSEGWEKDDLKQTCTIIQFTWDGHRVEKFHKEKIIAVWKAVVEFIQWFNTQTPQP